MDKEITKDTKVRDIIPEGYELDSVVELTKSGDNNEGAV